MIYVLDSKFRIIDLLKHCTFSQFEEKARDIGEFQINLNISKEYKYLLSKNKTFYFLFEKKYFGEMTSIEKSSDSEFENTYSIKGKMSHVFFENRVIARTIDFKGATCNFIESVIKSETANSPYNPNSKRHISLSVVMQDYMENKCSYIQKQITGGYVWEAIQPYLEQDNLVMNFVPIVTVSDLDSGLGNIYGWEVELSAGVDRTKHNKDGNEPIIFSQSLSNIQRTSYELDTNKYKNVAYIASEGEASDRKWFETSVEDGKDAVGWARKELWVDARDLQSKDQSGNSLTESQYNELIKQRSDEKFAEQRKEQTYTATLIQRNKYKYGVDYKLGDWVTINDEELGESIDVQIVGVTHSRDAETGEILDIEISYGCADRSNEHFSSKLESAENSIKYLESKVEMLADSLKIERGSNYTALKYSDGTMVLSQKFVASALLNQQYGTLYGGEVNLGAWAVPFKTTPMVTSLLNMSAYEFWLDSWKTYATGTDAGTPYVCRASQLSSYADLTIVVTAVGTWK